MKKAIVAILVAGLFAGCGRQEQSTQSNRPAFRAMALTTGSSMLPTFAESEVVTIELCKMSDLRAGDTVIFWHDGIAGYVHHRLVRRDDTTNRWITKGDNNQFQDRGLMTADEFVGRTHKFGGK